MQTSVTQKQLRINSRQCSRRCPRVQFICYTKKISSAISRIDLDAESEFLERNASLREKVSAPSSSLRAFARATHQHKTHTRIFLTDCEAKRLSNTLEEGGASSRPRSGLPRDSVLDHHTSHPICVVKVLSDYRCRLATVRTARLASRARKKKKDTPNTDRRR